MQTNVKQQPKKKHARRAGILMPVSSLPSNFGIGTLGEGAYAFIDWLHSAGIKIWQVLPLLPTGYGDSPYQSCCSDALNYYFIDFAILEKQGLLQASDYQNVLWCQDERRVDYATQFNEKANILRKAFKNFDQNEPRWQAFLAEGKYKDFALYMSLKIRFDYRCFDEWPPALKNAEKSALDEHERAYKDEIAFWQFTQFLFLQQWNDLRAYAKEKGIDLMGDMPIYVAYDSVETWKYRDRLFDLNAKGNVGLRAGVPPDGFCDDGQFWGNPVYNWEKLKKENYAWWKERILYAFTLFDIVRIDHFRGFDRYYAIPETAETAKEGEWLDGPKAALFKGMKNLQIVAEDLGVIDDGVRKLLKDTGYPGMKVFEFAFNGDPENEYLPSNYNENCVAYTGTHDNETLRAFIEQMDKIERRSFEDTLEEECLQADVPYIKETLDDECESIIRLLFSSKADTVIIPMQDVLCLGAEARLNAPATVSQSNWTFRFTLRDFKKRKAAWLLDMVQTYQR